MSAPHGRAQNALERAAHHAWLRVLALHPRPFLEEYQSAMEAMMAQRIGEERAAIGRLRFWARELGAVLLSAWRERRRGRRRQPRSGGTHDSMVRASARELRHALRRLARSPAFTLATVLTLALALGANIAIFSVVYRVVLRPLPWPGSEQLVWLGHSAPGFPGQTDVNMTEGLYLHYARHSRTLESVALYPSGEGTLSDNGSAQRVRMTFATPSLTHVLQVSPRLGRWFDEREGTPDGDRVVVLSHGLWLRRYGGDPGIIGRNVILNGGASQVIGVMPPAFDFPDPRTDIYVPAVIDAANPRVLGFGYDGVARLRPGVSLADVRTDLDHLIAQLPEIYPDKRPVTDILKKAGLAAQPVPLLEHVVGGAVQRTLWILLAAVGIVLLVACANVANLFLVRSERRQREDAVRRALGAGRRGIMMFYAAESALLSGAGAALGLGGAWLGVRLLARYGPRDLPRLHEVRLDIVVLGFSVCLALLSTLLFALLPLARRQRALAPVLHEGGRALTASAPRMRARHLLMAGQVALALVLLVGSGLMIRSFRALRNQNPGFQTEDALVFRIGLAGPGYADVTRVADTHDRIMQRIAALPGVRSVSGSTCLPLDGLCFWDPIAVQGKPAPSSEIRPMVSMRRVAPGWFETMGIHAIAGRVLERADLEQRSGAVVIDCALADRYFPGEDPVGQRVAPETGGTGMPWFTVVGVVPNLPALSLTEKQPAASLYYPLVDTLNWLPRPQELAYVVRTAVAPLSVLNAVRREVATVDPAIAVAHVTTLDGLLAQGRAQMAFTMTLLFIAATVAMMLGVIGIYGVISCGVSRRTAEIGVRMAVGARPRGVTWMILRQNVALMLGGIAAGLLGALATTRVLGSLLYGVHTRDPLTYAAVTALVLSIALLACLLPALQAARLDPLVALRKAE